jgi:hypothetical protein
MQSLLITFVGYRPQAEPLIGLWVFVDNQNLGSLDSWQGKV